MDSIDQHGSTSEKSLSFHGEGKSLFSIYIVNILLSIITLGIYYPWAKAAIMRYVYGETEFEGSRFIWHGTGLEMFKGILKAILLLAIIFGAYYGFIYIGMLYVGIAIYFVGLLLLIPLAIVGSLRYRTSRSSWRGIHFGYRGTYNKMLQLTGIHGFLLVIITFGIYTPWYIVKLYKEVFANLRMGDVKFKFTGEGGTYFGIFLGGYLLTIITFGIYAFKWQSDMYNYIISNIKLDHNDKEGTLTGTTTGMGIFELMIINALLIVFTLGLAIPWVIVRNLKYYFSNIRLSGEIDFATIQQTEQDMDDATGEGLLDSLELDLA